MKGILLTLLLFCFGQGVMATTIDTDLRSETLNAHLELLLPGTGLQEQSSRIFAKKRLQSLFAVLEKKKISKKKTSKAIQLIAEQLENQFFKKVTAFSKMDLLFKQGIYDQSTASALYALVFEYFNIPYSIKIKASDISVSIIAEDFIQEISIPQCQGLNEAQFRAFQMAYVELLRTVEYLPAQQWDRGPESLFQSYYLGKSEAFSLGELASFLLYRQALDAYKLKGWLACLDWLRMAQAASDFPVYKVLERVVWLQLSNQDKGGNLSLFYLWKLWEKKPNPVFQSELIHRFNSKVSNLETMTQWRIDSIYQKFEEGFEANDAAKEQLKATNYLVQARFFAKEGKTVEVMNFMDSLYAMRPQDADVHNVLAGMLVWSLKSERDFVKGLERISYYERKYPFLKEDPIFQDQHLFYRAERIRSHFDSDDYVLGGIYLKEFESLLSQMSPTIRHTSWVSTVYISSSNYYFREKQYDRALALINTALLSAPEDNYLLHRKDLLERYR